MTGTPWNREHGLRVKELRGQRRLTQAELADKAKVSLNTLQALEQGNTKDPRNVTLNRIASALSVQSSAFWNFGERTGCDGHDSTDLAAPDEPRRLEPRIEFLQNAVRVPTFRMNDRRLAQLVRVEDDALYDGSDNGSYASIILAYALLKLGPNACKVHRDKLTHTRSLAGKAEPESMAARWVLGRIDLAILSISKDANERIALARNAYKMFTEIERTKLQRPVLLPGSTQEYPLSSLRDDGDPGFDPVVQEVVIPHHYIVASIKILAHHEGVVGDKRLLCVPKYCRELTRSFDAVGPELNIEVEETGAHAIAYRRGLTTAGSVADRIVRLRDRIQAAGSCNLIPGRKEKEWLAHTAASLAIIAKSGQEYRCAIDAMRTNLMQLVAIRDSVPDSIVLDDEYRLAIESCHRDGFTELLNDLSLQTKNMHDEVAMSIESKEPDQPKL